MTNLRVLTELWEWHSPTWWLGLAAAVPYLTVAWRRRASLHQVGFFVASMAAFLIALASPLAALASRTLFSAHMAQHLLLLLIVPLCAMLAWPPDKGRFPYSGRFSRFIASLPLPVLRGRAGLGASFFGKTTEGPHPNPPLEYREREKERLARTREGYRVPVGWAAGVGAMWFWHIPALCTASMRSPLVFDIQIVSLMAAGAAFWWPVFSPIASRRMQPHLAAMYLFAGCVGCSLLGIYVTFSPVSVCPLYNAPVASSDLLDLVRDQWGFTHRIDQQVGGLLMWVPACIVYLGAILAKLSSWYHVPDQIPAA